MIIPLNITINGKNLQFIEEVPPVFKHQVIHGAHVYAVEEGFSSVLIQQVVIGDYRFSYLLFNTQQNATVEVFNLSLFKGMVAVLSGKCHISVRADNRFRLLKNYIVRMHAHRFIITAPTKYGMQFGLLMLAVNTPYTPPKTNNFLMNLGSREFGFPCLMSANLQQQLLQLIDSSYYPTYKGIHTAMVLRSLALFLSLESATNPTKMVYSQMDMDKLHTLKNKIDDFPGGDYRLSIVAQEMYVTEQRLAKGFKSLFGTTYRAYLQKIKMHQSRIQLEYTRTPLKQIAKEAGYRSTTNFIAAFKKMFNQSPAQYRISKGIDGNL